MSLLLNGDGHDERQVELEAKIEAKLASTGHDFLKVCSFGMLGSIFSAGFFVKLKVDLIGFLRQGWV